MNEEKTIPTYQGPNKKAIDDLLEQKNPLILGVAKNETTLEKTISDYFSGSDSETLGQVTRERVEEIAKLINRINGKELSVPNKDLVVNELAQEEKNKTALKTYFTCGSLLSAFSGVFIGYTALSYLLYIKEASEIINSDTLKQIEHTYEIFEEGTKTTFNHAMTYSKYLFQKMTNFISDYGIPLSIGISSATGAVLCAIKLVKTIDNHPETPNLSAKEKLKKEAGKVDNYIKTFYK